MAMMDRSSDGECCSDDDDDSTTSASGARDGARRSPMFPMPHSLWFPRSISFTAYVPPARPTAAVRGRGGLNARLHIYVTRPLAYKVTKDIVVMYQTCNPEFAYSPDMNPKRYLTAPSATVSENGMDNDKHDLVLYVNQVLANDDGTRRYVVKDLVGSGTVGQVAKCFTEETTEFVAVKVIKNLPAYYAQARFEIGILHMLNKEYDPDDKYHIVRCIDHFQHHGHLCIVFELLTENLYELLKKTNWKGMSLVLVRMFTKQLLESLSLLREARVIHCDLKPENILFSESFRSADVKLIDFGSACKEDQTVYTYIQSRFYRSPEVLLGHRYNTAIDMWSLGCVAAELFLGLPLFPGACDYDMLLFMKEKLESQPADHILRNAKHTNKFFKLLTAAPHSDHNHSAYQLLTPEEYEVRHRTKPETGRRYFQNGALAEAIMGFPLKPSSGADKIKEIRARESFVDFLKGLIECDPKKRWSPQQAAQHPFITNEPYTGPYVPIPETPRTPLNQSLVIDHRGAAGHWVGAGLSPQVGGLNQGPRHAATSNNPSRASSCGSAGSFGDGLEVEDYTMGMNNHQVGSSPDSNWQARPFVPLMHHPMSNQMRALNLSTIPSLNLGASPSHLYQMSPGPYGASPGGSFPSSPASSFSTTFGQHHLHREPWRGGGGAGAPPVAHARSGYAPGTLGAYPSPGSSMDAADDDSAHWDPDFADEILQGDVPNRSWTTSVGRLSYCSSLDGTSPASSHSAASGYRPKPGHFHSTQTALSRLRYQQTQQQQQQRHQRQQQVSPEQTPLRMRPQVSGIASFQQQFQFQQQPQNLFNHQQQQQQQQLHQDVKSGSLLPSPEKDNRLPLMYGLNPPIAMIAGIGHPMHTHQLRFYGGEELHHQHANRFLPQNQYAGGFLPQNKYFTNDLYFKESIMQSFEHQISLSRSVPSVGTSALNSEARAAEMSTLASEAVKPKLIGDNVVIDLTADLLGVSSTGYVIKTKFPGEHGLSVPCVLKRTSVVNQAPPDLARLKHKHVVHLIDYWIEEKDLFLVMEVLDGDLAELIARTKNTTLSPFSLHVAVDLMMQIGQAMLFLHEAGVSHPHLKCENVLYRATGQPGAYRVDDVVVKLGGFRCSRPADLESENRDVLCFGLTCLAILTGDLQRSIVLASPSIPEAVPAILKDCIVSCLETHPKSSDVVRMLSRAKSHIIEHCKDEHLCVGESMENDPAQEKMDSDREEAFAVHQLHPESNNIVSTSACSTFVVFHGFYKGPDEWRRTWMTRDNKLVWPQEWLPEDLGAGNIRVLSVSFDADSTLSNNYDRYEISKILVQRLVLSWNLGDDNGALFLIGHSFGGVLIKSLVTEAQDIVQNSIDQREAEMCKKFLKSLARIVFYSVPLEFESYVSECKKIVVLQRSSLLQSFQKDTRFVADMNKLSTDFERAVPENVKILAFLEGKPMSKRYMLVTEKSYEALSLGWEWHKIDKDNHFEVCRPNSKSHSGYKILLDHLRQDMEAVN